MSANDEGFREIQLNGKQLVFLFMAATVVSVVIFLCGVLVGRGVRPDRAPEQAIATAGIAADSDLAQAPHATPAPAAEPPVPADELSYPDRLQHDMPPQETLKQAVPPQVQEPPPVAVEPAPRPSVRPPAPERPPIAPNTASGPSDPSGPGFAVQVAAYKDRREADTLARQLVAKGYPAFVMDPVKGAPSAMYRVRVGKYGNRKEAEAISTRLETVEQFKPWIAR